MKIRYILENKGLALKSIKSNILNWLEEYILVEASKNVPFSRPNQNCKYTAIYLIVYTNTDVGTGILKAFFGSGHLNRLIWNKSSNTASGRRSSFPQFGCHQSKIHFTGVRVERDGKPFFFLLLTINLFHSFHSSTTFPQNDLCDQNQVCNKTTWPCAQSVLAIDNSHLFYFNVLTNLYWKQLFLAFTFSWNKTLVFVCYFCMLHTRENLSKNCIIP